MKKPDIIIYYIRTENAESKNIELPLNDLQDRHIQAVILNENANIYVIYPNSLLKQVPLNKLNAEIDHLAETCRTILSKKAELVTKNSYDFTKTIYGMDYVVRLINPFAKETEPSTENSTPTGRKTEDLHSTINNYIKDTEKTIAYLQENNMEMMAEELDHLLDEFRQKCYRKPKLYYDGQPIGAAVAEMEAAMNDDSKISIGKGTADLWRACTIHTLRYISNLWRDFEKVLIIDGRLSKNWRHFPKGTPALDVIHAFLDIQPGLSAIHDKERA